MFWLLADQSHRPQVKDMDYRLTIEGQSVLTGVMQIPHRLT